MNRLCFTIRCKTLQSVIDKVFFFHFSNAVNLNFFHLLRKGDYYRYLAEFKAGNDRNDVADQSLKAYEVYIWGVCIGLLILIFHH